MKRSESSTLHRRGARRSGFTTFALASLLVFALATGCAGKRPPAAGPPPGDIIELHMLTMPMAMNLDAKPGADGFRVKVYAVRRNDPKPASIREGSIEILMYDGTFSSPVGEGQSPLRTWSFPADKLAEHIFRTAIGTGYALTVQWGDQRPGKERVTIAARYRPPSGAPITSAAHSISVAGR